MVYPDVVVSSQTMEDFSKEDAEDYAYLQHRYLENQIRSNEELPEGMTLRRARRPPRIALWPALKLKLEELYKHRLHGERYRLLHLLREYDKKKFGGTIPKDLLTSGLSATRRDVNGQINDEEIQEIIEIDHDSNYKNNNREHEIIEINDDESTNEDDVNDNHDDTNEPSKRVQLRPEKTRSKATNRITLRPRRTKYNDPNTNTTYTASRTSSTAAVVDQIVSNNINNRGDDDSNVVLEDAVTTAVVVTGTNKKRKPNHQSRDHLKRKKSKKGSIQDIHNKSTIISPNDDDTNDGMYGDDDDDDNYYDNGDDPENDDDDSDISVVVATDTTMTNRGESIPNKLEERWNEMYIRLIAYNNKYQSTCVPRTCEDDPGLAIWVSNQRQLYNKNKLAKDRINRLNSIGFVWNFLNPSWNKMYERLVAYNKEKKSTCVPKRYQKDTRLAEWVQRQRRFFNTNKPRLTADRIAQLDSIGFVWNVLDAKWMEMYERLVAYKEQYGSTCVPYQYEIDRQLGLWVQKQRKNYNNTGNCKLSVDRRNLLNSIGFVWDIHDARWMELYARLVAYKDNYGSACVPQSYTADPQLGVWVDRQRLCYNNIGDRKLSVVRRNRLNSIGFIWNKLAAQWTEMYERLVAYKEQYTNTCVPRSYKADPQLATWVCLQRSNYNTNKPKLTAERINQLNSIDFIWNANE